MKDLTGLFPSRTKCHSLAENPFSLHAWQEEAGGEAKEKGTRRV